MDESHSVGLLYISVSQLLWVFRGHRVIEDLQVVIRRDLLKKILFGWNLALAVQSAVSFGIAWPLYFEHLSNQGFWGSICNSEWNTGTLSTIGLLFVWSKIVELGDTIFLVLSFKEVPFLHWYHHVTVLWQTFSSQWSSASTGILFIMMNLAVHSLMYTYQALKSLNFNVPGSQFITSLQIVQMIVGMAAQIKAYQNVDCETARTNTLAGLLMQTSQAVLFLQQAVKRQCRIRSSIMEAVDLAIGPTIFARIRGLTDAQITNVRHLSGLSDDDLRWPSAQKAFLDLLKKKEPESSIKVKRPLVVHTFVNVCVESQGAFSLDAIKSTTSHKRPYFALRLHIADIPEKEVLSFLKSHTYVTLHEDDRFRASHTLRAFEIPMILPDGPLRKTGLLSCSFESPKLVEFVQSLDIQFRGLVTPVFFINRKDEHVNLQDFIPEGLLRPEPLQDTIVRRNVKKAEAKVVSEKAEAKVVCGEKSEAKVVFEKAEAKVVCGEHSEMQVDTA